MNRKKGGELGGKKEKIEAQNRFKREWKDIKENTAINYCLDQYTCFSISLVAFFLQPITLQEIITVSHPTL